MTANSNDIILHHFDISPFAEKARLAFGLKQLSWHSVEIPLIMPKPKLTALTGGYRKTPVMQIGADVFCDTQAIAAELERRFPNQGPSLFPDNSKGLCIALSAWSDAAFFQPGAGLSMGTNEGLPEDLLADRRAFFSFMDFQQLDAQLPDLYGQFRAHLQLIENMLADGRAHLFGEQANWADILAYFPVWMSRSNIVDSSELTKGLTNLLRWEARMIAVGHGDRTELDADQALEIAAAAEPVDTAAAVAEDACFSGGPAAGDAVTVSANDYGREQVTGTLVQLNQESICIHRQDERLGTIAVHFPRIGYNVSGVK